MGAMLAPVYDGVEQIVSTFSRKFTKAQLKYTDREQELLVAYKACKHFHPIKYGCDVTIECDHTNITRAETQHANLCVLWQLIALDHVYQAKLEHIAGTSNTGADGLSRLHMYDTIPNILIQQIYVIDKLDRANNLDSPLSMEEIREEQNIDEKL